MVFLTIASVLFLISFFHHLLHCSHSSDAQEICFCCIAQIPSAQRSRLISGSVRSTWPNRAALQRHHQWSVMAVKPWSCNYVCRASRRSWIAYRRSRTTYKRNSAVRRYKGGESWTEKSCNTNTGLIAMNLPFRRDCLLLNRPFAWITWFWSICLSFIWQLTYLINRWNRGKRLSDYL